MSRQYDSDGDDDEKYDYLEVDRPVPGQNYVCLSFVSPDSILMKKDMFYLHEYLKENSEKYNLSQSAVVEEFKDWMYTRKKKLNEKFDRTNNFKTSVRGVKIRGTYLSLQEAQVRAKVLQKLDDSFHVFVGQVGYWLPWDPEADHVEGQEYADEELNTLMKKYKENKLNKDIHYEQMKKERQEKRMREKLERDRKKKEETAATETNVVEETAATETNVVEETAATETNVVEVTAATETNVVEVTAATETNVVEVTAATETTVGGATSSDSIENTFTQVDPWLQRKQQQNNVTEI